MPAGQHWSTRAHHPGPPAPLPRHASAAPAKHVSSASPLPGRSTPPPLGAICLVKFKSNPFDVPLPTPSQLPAKNAGDFSFSPAADKSQIVPVALFEVADTSESGCEPPPSLASARGKRGTDLRRGPLGWAVSPGLSQQPHRGAAPPRAPPWDPTPAG